jgi:hypothetical protein
VKKDLVPKLKSTELQVFMIGQNIRSIRKLVKDTTLAFHIEDADAQNNITLGHMRKATLRSLELKALAKNKPQTP